MIIKELKLYNFGVYAGENIFEFVSNKPIVLVGGMNGRGKTTFLEAILLSLYGQNSFAYQESKFKSYGQYLKSYINLSDGSNEASIELYFSLDSSEKETYRIKRSWNGFGYRVKEDITVYKNEIVNPFLTENWPMFIENILPSRLSNFFFFDGEKIAEVAVEDTDTKMKESIRSLLGISVLDVLSNDMSRIISRSTKKNTDDKSVLELQKLRSYKDEMAKKMSDLDARIKEKKLKLDEKIKHLDLMKNEYKAKGGDVVKQREDLYQKKISLVASLNQCNELLINDAASQLPLVLVRNLLLDIEEQAILEQDKKTLAMTLYQMKYMLKSYKKEFPDNAEKASHFINYIDENAESGDIEEIYGLSDNVLFRLQSLLDKELSEKIENARKHLKMQNSNRKEIDQLENYLSVDIDEKALAKLYKTIKTLEAEITEIEVKINSLEGQYKSLNAQFLSVNVEFKKKVESYLQKVELNDDIDRLLKYSQIANNIIDEYKIRLQKRKVSVVAETMTQCYKLLANKKTLIDKILMNEETLDLKYINFDGEEVEKASLSAGEKQLMVISLLWALAKCSKRKLPVIIDTPLSRLDSNHRETLINSYFPNASEQTIILSTDSEITKDYYKMMKENVGDEFTLVYNDDTKSTSIHSGYFMEDRI
ncbi:DNA sulfur modification protein DndD [Clostridium sp. C45]|uniref:DNA sulfur modification protein DndD n=1 Tax=Clostridium sp. 10cd* TaxID=3373596 RepID=UPI0037BE9524